MSTRRPKVALPTRLPRGLSKVVVGRTRSTMAGAKRYRALTMRAVAPKRGQNRGPTAETGTPIHTGPKQTATISVEAFARRAADRAAEGCLPVLEVTSGEHSYRQLFDAERYQFVASPLGNYVDSLPVESGRFGVVLCSGVVERTPEPCEVLAELNRALDQAGRLFLSTPLVVSPRRPRLTPGQLTVPLGLNYLLQASGFELEDLQAVEATSSYAVVARKAATSGRAIATRGRLCRPG